MKFKSRPLFLALDQQLQSHQKRKRFMFWALFYAVVIVTFSSVINNKIHAVNTKLIPPGQITLAATKIQYNSGDTVQVVLKNGLANTIYYNNKCPQEPLSVYRFENNVWSRMHTTIDNASCAAQPKQIAVAPGTTYSVDYSKWAQLFSNPGIYRVAALADNYNGLAYTDFDILAPPPKPITPQTQIQTIYKTIYTPVYIQVPQYIQQPGQSSTTTPTTTTPSSTGTTGTTGSTGSTGSTGTTGGTRNRGGDN